MDRADAALLAQFIVVLDVSIVNVALPWIGEALSFSQENLSWVLNVYVLTFGGFTFEEALVGEVGGRPVAGTVARRSR